METSRSTTRAASGFSRRQRLFGVLFAAVFTIWSLCIRNVVGSCLGALGMLYVTARPTHWSDLTRSRRRLLNLLVALLWALAALALARAVGVL